MTLIRGILVATICCGVCTLFAGCNGKPGDSGNGGSQSSTNGDGDNGTTEPATIDRKPYTVMTPQEIAQRDAIAIDQMNQIMTAMMIFADTENDGEFFSREQAYSDETNDPWVEILIDVGVPAETFVSPYADNRTAYYTVPERSLDDAPNSVILYENPAMHNNDGGHIGYLDGTVRWHDEAEFWGIIENLPLRGPGQWTPHRWDK